MQVNFQGNTRNTWILELHVQCKITRKFIFSEVYSDEKGVKALCLRKTSELGVSKQE